MAMRDWADAEIIRAAAEMPRLTSRSNQVGGFGLKNVREVVLDRGGRLTVLSLTAKVNWSGDDVTTESLPNFCGTAVELEFRLDVGSALKEALDHLGVSYARRSLRTQWLKEPLQPQLE